MLRTCLVAVLLTAVTCLSTKSVLAQSSGPGTTGVASLQETLEKGLKARQPAEFAFVATVVDKVNSGQLPVNLVDTTFQWARRKDHPFESFEFALRARAKKAGILL